TSGSRRKVPGSKSSPCSSAGWLGGLKASARETSSPLRVRYSPTVSSTCESLPRSVMKTGPCAAERIAALTSRLNSRADTVTIALPPSMQARTYKYREDHSEHQHAPAGSGRGVSATVSAQRDGGLVP